MRDDLEIPARYGIAQSIGDTGGLTRGLRNLPVLVGLARTMERVCPDVWLLNLTNPMATLVRAVATATSILAHRPGVSVFAGANSVAREVRTFAVGCAVDLSGAL